MCCPPPPPQWQRRRDKGGTGGDGPGTHLAPVGVVLLLVGVEELRQAEVGDLDVLRRLHQDIARSQVPVHQVALLQVVHPLGGTAAARGRVERRRQRTALLYRWCFD